MEKEIKKIIETQLPAQTAGVMKEYIEGAELTEKTLRTVQKELETAADRIVTQDAQLKKYGDIRAEQRDLDDRKCALDDREDLITQRENNATVIESGIRMEMMNNNMSNMHELVAKVFGHPAVTVTKNGHIVTGNGVQNSYGGWDGASYSEPVTETETTVEGKS